MIVVWVNKIKIEFNKFGFFVSVCVWELCPKWFNSHLDDAIIVVVVEAGVVDDAVVAYIVVSQKNLQRDNFEIS